MSRYFFFLCLLIGWCINSANAQQDSMQTKKMIYNPIHADHPMQSQSAYLTPRGFFQMEHSFSIEDTDPGFVYSYPNSLWKFGVNDNFELRLSTHYITIQHEPNPDLNGFLPVAFGFKSRLAEQKGILLKIAFIGQLTFPGIVSEELETTYFGPSLRLVFNNAVSKAFTVNYSVGADWDGESSEPNFTYALAPVLNLTNRFSIFAELYGSQPQREEDYFNIRADAGITYLVSNDFQLEVSAGDGISDDATSRFVAAGFSYRFKL